MNELSASALARAPTTNAWLEHLASLQADTAPLTQPSFFKLDDAPLAPPPGRALINLQGVHTRLGRQTFGTFDVALQSGDRVAILGPSGAGKSTLLRLMSGELPPQRGQVQMRGRDLRDWPRAALSAQRAVLPQSPAAAFGLPVDLVVALGRVARDSDPQLAHIVAQSLQAAHAAHLQGRRFDTLSGGERSRVQLARVLAQLWDTHDAALLVDEPMAALDPGLQFELMDALADFADARGHALVAVLHDIGQALQGFSRLWLVHEGRLVADLKADRAALPALEALYGIALQCIDTGDGEFVLRLRPRAAAVAMPPLAAMGAR